MIFLQQDLTKTSSTVSTKAAAKFEIRRRRRRRHRRLCRRRRHRRRCWEIWIIRVNQNLQSNTFSAEQKISDFFAGVEKNQRKSFFLQMIFNPII